MECSKITTFLKSEENIPYTKTKLLHIPFIFSPIKINVVIVRKKWASAVARGTIVLTEINFRKCPETGQKNHSTSLLTEILVTLFWSSCWYVMNSNKIHEIHAKYLWKNHPPRNKKNVFESASLNIPEIPRGTSVLNIRTFFGSWIGIVKISIGFERRDIHRDLRHHMPQTRNSGKRYRAFRTCCAL